MQLQYIYIYIYIYTFILDYACSLKLRHFNMLHFFHTSKHKLWQPRGGKKQLPCTPEGTNCDNYEGPKSNRPAPICFNMLPYASRCFNMLQYASMRFDMLQYASMCFHTLQYACICSNMLPYVSICFHMHQHVSICSNVIPCVSRPGEQRVLPEPLYGRHDLYVRFWRDD